MKPPFHRIELAVFMDSKGRPFLGSWLRPSGFCDHPILQVGEQPDHYIFSGLEYVELFNVAVVPLKGAKP